MIASQTQQMAKYSDWCNCFTTIYVYTYNPVISNSRPTVIIAIIIIMIIIIVNNNTIIVFVFLLYS